MYLYSARFVWKSEKPVKIVEEDKDGKKDIVNCSHPVELISTLLRKLGGTASVNQLCQVRADFLTNRSWNCYACTIA